jgi:hypothetical protein
VSQSQHTTRCAKEVARAAMAAGKPDWFAAREVHNHCGLSLLRAHRIVQGWTLQAATERLQELFTGEGEAVPRISHQRMSKWETGPDIPTPRYLDALCRLYKTRPDRLGFGLDYGEEKRDQSESDYETASTARHPVSDSRIGLPQWTHSQDDSRDEDVDRRQVLKTLALFTGATISAQLLDALRSVRRETDSLLETQSVGPSSIDAWEELAHGYGYLQLSMSPIPFLARLTSDFIELNRILSRRQPLESQSRLYRVMAQLAGMIACDVNVVADSRETHAWFRTARLAAEESNDRALRAWVLANEAMSYLWYNRSADKAVELARTAQAVAGSRGGASAALAAAMEARGLAKLGHATQARKALHGAESRYERLEGSDIELNLLAFHEHLLRFCQSNALTLLGDSTAALAVQGQAQSLGNSGVVDSVLLDLDRSICLARLGEAEHAARVAIQALEKLSPESREGLAAFRTRSLEAQIPHTARGIASVRQFRHLLQVSVVARQREPLGEAPPSKAVRAL